MKPNSRPKAKQYSVPALEKTLNIIEELAHSDHPLGTSDIAARIHEPKSSIFMILSMLQQHHYVEKDEHGKYQLTLKLYQLGLNVLNKIDIREVARPSMEALAEELKYTVHLATLVGGKAVYVEKVQGPSFVQFSTHIGQSWYLHHSGVGKVLAAYLPDKELDQILEQHGMPPSTSNTITSVDTFKELLGHVRDVGYAVEDEEGENGIRCIAAPVFDYNQKVVAALSVTALRVDLPLHNFSIVAERVKEQAMFISKQFTHAEYGE